MDYSAQIDGSVIVDWDSFHDEFQKQLGFFDGYGRNMDAWNDCMRDMYTNGEYKSLTKFDLSDGDTFTLVVVNTAQRKRNAEEVFSAFKGSDSALQHLHVQAKAHAVNLSTLFVAQQFPRASNLEIMGCQHIA